MQDHGPSIPSTSRTDDPASAGSSQPVPLPPAVGSPDWRAALVAWLHARKSYPEAARRQSIQGRVLVRFIVGRDGEIRDVVVLQGSGFEALDTAAVAMLRGARAPAFPTDMAGDRISITAPITYVLNR